MKLGALKSAIRAAPTLFCTAGLGGRSMKLVLQKTPTLEELDRLWPEGRATETGLRLTAEGQLEPEP